MSQSNDAGHFFQTTESLATSERKAAKAKNKHGNPIKLPSKILAAQADPTDSTAVFVAEAAGEVKRVTLETGSIRKIFAQGTAPLTCLAVSLQTKSIFAGCWDKNIYKIPIDGGRATQVLQGHSDFVKCLLATSLSGKPILLSGGADSSIVVWDLETGKQLHRLKGPTKSLQDFTIDPLSLPEGADEPLDSFILFSASSDREIRRWHIARDAAYELPESLSEPILVHDTSIYKLCFDSDGDLWTASADKTAKHLVRARNWEVDTTLQHPDFVRDIVVTESAGVVITACRDEEVRLWNMSTGDLLQTYSGHYEEVTGLILAGNGVVSVSIDGTVRSWGLTAADIQLYNEAVGKERQGNGGQDEQAKGAGMLTAEEEAELAELMNDDD